jgi:hypothetical protein
MKSGTVVSYSDKGLVFGDGEEIEADVIVFATGFEGNMRYLVEKIFGEEVAGQMGDFWGLDGEGEVRGAFKGCGREFSFSFQFLFLFLFHFLAWVWEMGWVTLG